MCCPAECASGTAARGLSALQRAALGPATMRYLVARGANSPAESRISASWQENLTVRDPSRKRTKSLLSIRVKVLAWTKEKNGMRTKGSPTSEPSHGETLGTATPVTGGGKRPTGAHRFCRASVDRRARGATDAAANPRQSKRERNTKTEFKMMTPGFQQAAGASPSAASSKASRRPAPRPRR